MSQHRHGNIFLMNRRLKCILVPAGLSQCLTRSHQCDRRVNWLRANSRRFHRRELDLAKIDV
jgi:hypothetical protein